MARKEAAPSAVPVGLIVGIVAAVLAIGGIAALSYWRISERGCTPTGDHEHAAFGVYLDNRSVMWSNNKWVLGQAGGLEGHIHAPNWQTIHMESADHCITVKTFFEKTLQTTVTAKQITLDSIDHGGQTVVNGQNGQLRFFLGTPYNWTFGVNHTYVPADKVNWVEAPDLPDHQPRDGEYVLLTFGKDQTDADIQWQEHSIPIQIRAE